MFCRYLSWAQLLVDTQVLGSSTIPSYSHKVMEVALEGFGTYCAVDIWPPTIKRAGQIHLGQESTFLTVAYRGKDKKSLPRSAINDVNLSPGSSQGIVLNHVHLCCRHQAQMYMLGHHYSVLLKKLC